mmetsp:Transcript_4317/g.5001  ORF Transcript_4317/g.5001 Transcript_4317/m.5001 type:complete len:249 (+) Transcript_4317:218-964(+)|eukprot:CAMPEP_0184016858 /NCGR_PEP_ID=MMETSP0954-20121128/7173_1 /TAXON_ID=627963 /ORGANISM="Aplanochytrium sp, Strain PBS07" /LENGTH=248 /DNA_ID=CAMNT_0026297947 /DNA_START=156 /DNA_END=902 /DNA_ORIENTATION=-
MALSLYYFNLRAKGEVLQMVLEYAAVTYKLEEVDISKWSTMNKDWIPKGHTGRTQLPVLKLQDGTIMPESLDIAKYIWGLNPSLSVNDVEKADYLFKIQDNSSTPFGDGYNSFGIIDPILNFFDRKTSLTKLGPYFKGLPKALIYLNQELGEGPYFGGSSPHYGDFAIFHLLDNIYQFDKGSTIDGLGEKAATLRKFYGLISELPAIKTYLQNRAKAGSGKVGSPGSIIHEFEFPYNSEDVKEALNCA